MSAGGRASAGLDGELVRTQRRDERAPVEIAGRHHALAPGAADDDHALAAEEDGGQFGRGVGVDDAPHHRPPGADGRVPEVAERLGQERRAPLRPALERALAHEGAHRERAAARLETVQADDAVDVDHHRRPRQAQVQHRHQALAAGEDLGVVAVTARRSIASATLAGAS